IERERGAGRGRHRGEALPQRIEVKARPLRALERPFVLVPLDEALAGMAELELDRRLAVPAGILTLEEMAEEAFLQPHAVIGIEIRPVLDTVRFEPFLRRGGADEAFEIAARMESLAAPIGGAEQRHRDLRPVRRARVVIGIIERMGEDLGAEIAAVARELGLAQRL